MTKLKFEVDDLVYYKYDNNPNEKVVAIGKVEAIYVPFGKSIFANNPPLEVTYRVSGNSCSMKEDQLHRYNKDIGICNLWEKTDD